MTAVGETDSSLAIKCLAFCQTLTDQGKAFNFSLTIGSTFSLSLDTRQKELFAVVKKKKKASPSTTRRNTRRREEFLKKKKSPATVDTISPATTASKQVSITATKSDPPVGDPSFYQFPHNPLTPAFMSSGEQEEEPVFTEESKKEEYLHTHSFVPSPPPCSTCSGYGIYCNSRMEQNRSWHHAYICLGCRKAAKLVTLPQTPIFTFPSPDD